MRRAFVFALLLAACGADKRPKLPRSDAGVVLPGGALDRRAYIGRTLFVEHCSVCHGKQGAGDGFNAFNLDPRPPDLRGAVVDRGLDYVRQVVFDGSAKVGKSALCPPRRHTLKREEPALVLAYLRTLEKPE